MGCGLNWSMQRFVQYISRRIETQCLPRALARESCVWVSRAAMSCCVFRFRAFCSDNQRFHCAIVCGAHHALEEHCDQSMLCDSIALLCEDRRIEWRHCKSRAFRSRSGGTPGRPLFEYAALKSLLISPSASSTMRLIARSGWFGSMSFSTLMLCQRLPLYSGWPRVKVRSQKPPQRFFDSLENSEFFSSLLGVRVAVVSSRTVRSHTKARQVQVPSKMKPHR